MFVTTLGYKDYDNLGPKQKKRRVDEIGKITSSFLNDLGGSLGLVPKSLDLMSTKTNETVPVPLDHSSQNSPQESSANSAACSETGQEDVIDRILYLIMKHNVPMEFYHEMAASFPELPRSYKVIDETIVSYMYMSIFCCRLNQGNTQWTIYP